MNEIDDPAVFAGAPPTGEQPSVQDVLSQLPDAMLLDFLTTAIQTAKERQLSFPSEASGLPGVAQQERAKAEGWMSPYDKEAWKILTPEQAERAGSVKGVMAEFFGGSLADYSVILEEPGPDADPDIEEVDAYVVYTADHAIPVSPDLVFSDQKPELFTVKVDQEAIDARHGMTFRLYSAMIDTIGKVKFRGTRLKSDRQAAIDRFPENQGTGNATWLSGELLLGESHGEASVVPIANTYDGEPARSWWSADIAPKGAGLRPVVWVGNVYGSNT